MAWEGTVSYTHLGDKAKTYAKERGIPKWYDDAQELIDDEEVNAVYIATPPSSHATYAIMSMKAGKPVYIEKPMAVTYEAVSYTHLDGQQRAYGQLQEYDYHHDLQHGQRLYPKPDGEAQQ